jgi:hypothetical protein
LKPALPADRAALIRRVTFDLTGLPPAPEEIDAFLADKSPRAWEKVVDRLLASPHYGEQWGRHWLDVVSFAESDGYEYDMHRPEPGATAITWSRASMKKERNRHKRHVSIPRPQRSDSQSSRGWAGHRQIIDLRLARSRTLIRVGAQHAITIGSGGDGGRPIEHDGQDESQVIVGVFADQIDPAGALSITP